jgi:hypothetical protein
VLCRTLSCFAAIFVAAQLASAACGPFGTAVDTALPDGGDGGGTSRDSGDGGSADAPLGCSGLEQRPTFCCDFDESQPCPWSKSTSVGADAKIVSDVSRSAPNALYAFTPAVDAGVYAYAYLTADVGSGRALHVEFDALLGHLPTAPDSACNIVQLWFTDGNGTDEWLNLMVMSGGAPRFEIHEDLPGEDLPSSPFELSGTVTNPSGWFHVVVDFDLAAQAISWEYGDPKATIDVSRVKHVLMSGSSHFSIGIRDGNFADGCAVHVDTVTATQR